MLAQGQRLNNKFEARNPKVEQFGNDKKSNGLAVSRPIEFLIFSDFRNCFEFRYSDFPKLKLII